MAPRRRPSGGLRRPEGAVSKVAAVVGACGGAGFAPAKQETPAQESRIPGRSIPPSAFPSDAPGPSPQETVLLNAPAGALRVIARLRPTPSERSMRATRFHSRSVGLARGLGARLASLAHVAHLGPRPGHRPLPVTLRRSLVIRLASERMIPIVAALMVLGASMVSLQPAAAQPIGQVSAGGTDVRLAVGGGDAADQPDPFEVAGLFGGPRVAAAGAEEAPAESYARRRHDLQARRRRHDRPRRQGPAPDVHGPGGRHAHRHRQPLRRLDDDRLVGQQAQLEGRPPRRPEADDPAPQRPRGHGQGRRHP